MKWELHLQEANGIQLEQGMMGNTSWVNQAQHTHLDCHVEHWLPGEGRSDGWVPVLVASVSMSLRWTASSAGLEGPCRYSTRNCNGPTKGYRAPTSTLLGVWFCFFFRIFEKGFLCEALGVLKLTLG